MRHQPHILVPGPWSDGSLGVPESARAHLDRVLRYPDGGQVTYTDGAGTVGAGRWVAGSIERGAESFVPRQGRTVTVAVSPPKSKDRQRFCVEKLQELGVARLSWMSSDRTQGRPPRADRATSWAIGALEQSRGAWLMEIGTDDGEDRGPSVVAHPAGTPISDVEWQDPVTVVIGPEGGLTDDELKAHPVRACLGATILRTETAAIVAAVHALG